MDESSIREHILTSFPDIGITDAGGDSYFCHAPHLPYIPFAGKCRI